MNIQIYGKNKCFDTKKAQRYFQERRVKFQFVDLPRFGMGPRELENVARADFNFKFFMPRLPSLPVLTGHYGAAGPPESPQTAHSIGR